MQYFKPVPHGTPGSWLHNGQAWAIADVSLMPDLMESLTQSRQSVIGAINVLSNMDDLAGSILDSLKGEYEDSDELQDDVEKLRDYIAVAMEALEA